MTQSETQNEIVTKRYRATCFPIGDGIWVSTCHRNEERITQGIAQGTTEIEVAGERFPVIDARFSKRADYCLLSIEDRSHTGFTISSKMPIWIFYTILLSEGENRTFSAVPCAWPRTDDRPKTEDRSKATDTTDDSSIPGNIAFPLRSSGLIVPGYSGSPVLNNGKVVGLVVAREKKISNFVLAVPFWEVFPELNEMIAELKHDSQERGCQ